MERVLSFLLKCQFGFVFRLGRDNSPRSGQGIRRSATVLAPYFPRVLERVARRWFVPLEGHLVRLLALLGAPFQDFGAVWLGLVPLYVSLLLGELYRKKVSFGHAVVSGVVMLWAGVNWAMHLSNLGVCSYLGNTKDRTAIAWIVAACAVGLGIFTIILGLRKKDR